MFFQKMLTTIKLRSVLTYYNNISLNFQHIENYFPTVFESCIKVVKLTSKKLIMTVLYQLMAIFLACSNIYVLAPVGILGFFFFDTTIFGTATTALQFTMIYSRFLKSIFVLLIPSSEGVGHVFPSGHMCASVAFYGWLLISIQNKVVNVLIIVLLAGIGSSLVYFDYHNWIDICGGVLFGSILIVFLFFVLQKVNIFQEYPYLIGTFMLFIGVLILIANYFISPLTGAQYAGLYLLIGYPVFWMCYHTLLTILIMHKTLSQINSSMV